MKKCSVTWLQIAEIIHPSHSPFSRLAKQQSHGRGANHFCLGLREAGFKAEREEWGVCVWDREEGGRGLVNAEHLMWVANDLTAGVKGLICCTQTGKSPWATVSTGSLSMMSQSQQNSNWTALVSSNFQNIYCKTLHIFCDLSDFSDICSAIGIFYKWYSKKM